MTEQDRGDSDALVPDDLRHPGEESELPTADGVAVPEAATSSRDLARLNGLVLDAFKAAAQQGRPNWNVMHGPVLKNRLLDLTNRSFSELDYGVTKFAELVELLRDTLRADYSKRPFVVELLDPHYSEVAKQVETSGASWIRPDLWTAVIDYSSPHTRYWLPSSDTVVDSLSDSVRNEAIALPSLTRELLHSWRSEFADEREADLDDVELRKVELWLHKALGTSALPSKLISEWNRLVRGRVEQMLREFFEANGLQPPDDFLGIAPDYQPTSHLRSFVLRCIGLMSENELRQLPIPAHIAMRAHR